MFKVFMKIKLVILKAEKNSIVQFQNHLHFKIEMKVNNNEVESLDFNLPNVTNFIFITQTVIKWFT